MKLFTGRPRILYSGHHAKIKKSPSGRVAIAQCMFNNGGTLVAENQTS